MAYLFQIPQKEKIIINGDQRRNAENHRTQLQNNHKIATKIETFKYKLIKK